MYNNKCCFCMTYDPNPVPVLFSDSELNERVRGIIANMSPGDEVSMSEICLLIIQMAESEGKLKADTKYSSSELSPRDQERVSVIMWDLILERKVYTLFGSYLWFGQRQDNTLFIVR